jgi:DNA-binding transcriptional MerR regulator
LPEVLRHPIGEAAKLVGVSTATLRLWEQVGFIQPQRTQSGHRLYDNEDIGHLRWIQYLRREHGLNFAAIRLDPSLQKQTQPKNAITISTNEGQELGRKLRVYRHKKKLTLKQTSKQAGVSVSFISAVERGATGISLASLLKLSLVYNIHLSDLYKEASSNNHKLVRIAERQIFEQNLAGVRIEQLTHGPALMEAQRFVLEPGASSEGSYSHEGEEMIYVLDGCVDFYLGESEHHHLEAGDCLYFSSSLYHRWENDGISRTSLLWVAASLPNEAENVVKLLPRIDNPVQLKGRR